MNTSLDKTVFGHLVGVSVDVRAYQPSAAWLRFRWDIGGQFSSMLEAEHPGDGQWTTLSCQAQIPPEADGVTVWIVLLPGSALPCEVDNVRAEILD